MAIIIPEGWAHRPDFKWTSNTPDKLACPYGLPGDSVMGFCAGKFDDWKVEYMKYRHDDGWDGVHREGWYHYSWRDHTWLDGIWFAAQAYGPDKIKSDMRTLFYARPVCVLDHATGLTYVDYGFLTGGFPALLATYLPEDRDFMSHIYCMLYYGMAAEYHKANTGCGGVIKIVAGMHMLDYPDAYVWGELRDRTYEKHLRDDVARVDRNEDRDYTAADKAAFDGNFLRTYDRADGVATESVGMSVGHILEAGEKYGVYWDDPRNRRLSVAREALGRTAAF